MPKYSTGDAGGGGDADACELCGREETSLQRANVAGADLLVCSDCAPHGDNRAKDEKKAEADSDRGDGPDRQRRAAQQQARMYDAAQGDSTRWETEGTNYEADRLPYLVRDYGPRAETARQDAGLTVEELARELGLEEDDVLAVEQGRAARANVGGSVVRALEDRLDVELIEE